jgi:DNA-binding transcriptional MerR regulator/quercetin dioxygenase-like cupin family protein
MVRTRDTESPAPLYISIGEAARLAGVSAATLRNWERRGLIAPARSATGYRRFTLADIEHLQRLSRSFPRDAVDLAPAGDQVHAEANGRQPPATVPWGARLREQRQQRALSLRQVAALTGLSASFISGIERGIAHPSVAALQKLTAAYGVSIVDLMEVDIAPRGRLVRVSERERYDPAAGVTMDQLNFGRRQMELHLFTVEPGAGSGGTYHHDGEEFIMMLAGTLRVAINTIEHYLLAPGDVLYFESTHRHEWVNPGPDVAVFLGVNTPRTF